MLGAGTDPESREGLISGAGAGGRRGLGMRRGEVLGCRFPGSKCSLLYWDPMGVFTGLWGPLPMSAECLRNNKG